MNTSEYGRWCDIGLLYFVGIVALVAVIYAAWCFGASVAVDRLLDDWGLVLSFTGIDQVMSARAG